MICVILEKLGKEKKKMVGIRLIPLIRDYEVPQSFIILQKIFKDLQNFPKLI